MAKDFVVIRHGEKYPMIEDFEAQVRQAEPTIWDSPLDLPALIDTEPEPISWFVHRRIPAGRGAVCSGIGGSSKTRLLYHLAVGAAIGCLPWDWQISRTGKSLLVMTEDTAGDFHRTLHFLCLSLNLAYEEKRAVYHSILPFPLAGENCLLLQKTQKNTLEESPLFLRLVDKIREIGDVVFVGLDPALSLTSGDEMDQGHQRQLGKMADNLGVLTGAAAMLIAHAPKNHKDEITSHNSRGGGALVDAVRSEFVMRTMTLKEAQKAKITDAEERHRHVQLIGTKGNYLPPEAYVPVWLRRDEYGNLAPADTTFSDDTASGPSPADYRALKVLEELCEHSTPKLRDWRDVLIEQGLIKAGPEKTQENAMDRIRKRLYDLGLIRKGGRGIWIPENQEIDMMDFNTGAPQSLSLPSPYYIGGKGKGRDFEGI